MKKFTLWEIVDEAVKQYGLSNEEPKRKAYYYRIRRELDNHKADNGMTVWDSGAEHVEGQKKDNHRFSVGILNSVLNDWCKEYFIKQSEKKCEELKSFRQEVKENENKIQTEMSEQGYNDDFDMRSYVTEEELRLIKLERMVSALFELYFSPFDDEALREDLDVIRNTNNTSPQDIRIFEMEAFKRFNNRQSYYTKK